MRTDRKYYGKNYSSLQIAGNQANLSDDQAKVKLRAGMYVFKTDKI